MVLRVSRSWVTHYAALSSLLLVATGFQEAVAQETERVSISSDGVEGNSISLQGKVSGNGRFVVFSSLASNLVPGDANNSFDVFVRDLQTHKTEIVSLSSSGGPALGDSFQPSISADGRFVAFTSLADNLVDGDPDPRAETFVRDRLLGTTERVSVSTSGERGNGNSSFTSISADGRFVVFNSDATNLVDAPINLLTDVFIRDRQTRTTRLVSIGASGEAGNDFSNFGDVSADGRFVTFLSRATNLVAGDTGISPLFVRDLQLGQTSLVSVNADGSPAMSGGIEPQISDDGGVVVFTTASDDLLGSDLPNVGIVLRDRNAGTTERIAAPDFGVAETPSLSGDARFVAFDSDSALVPEDTNGLLDVFRVDRTTGQVLRFSLASDGSQASDGCFGASVSDSGQSIAFISFASNLVPGDTNGTLDVFVRRIGAEPPTDQAPLAIEIRLQTRGPVNPQSQKPIDVLLLGSAAIPVATIDRESIRLSASATPESITVRDGNGDGLDDLLLGFRARASGIQAGDTKICVSARTLDGRALQGCDAIRTVGR